MSGNTPFLGKKILYVTSAWAGLIDILNDECGQPKGMPAFFHPLIELDRLGAKIELVIFLDQSIDRSNMKNCYFNNTTVTILPWPQRKTVRSVFTVMLSFVCLYLKAKKIRPEFIYALGTTGVLGVLLSKVVGVPVGVRVFGINKYYDDYTVLGKLKFILASPLLFLTFRLKSKFLIATDDGSSADKLFAEIGHKKTNFLFWKNGFDDAILFDAVEVRDQPFLLYPARITDKKQQMKAVELLRALDLRGCKSLTLKLVGHVTDPAYLKEIYTFSERVGLKERVEFCGTFERKILYSYMRQAVAVLNLQKISNLGNTLIEALACESVVLSYKEPALEAFLENGKSAILVDNISIAADEVIAVMEDADYASALRKGGRRAVDLEFDNWNDRVVKELEQIDLAMEK